MSTQIPRLRRYAGLSTAEAFDKVAADWRDALPARVIAPDPRVALAWERCAAHVLFAMECGLPRIGVANYPILWLRDGVIILRALDLIGRHDLARVGSDYLTPLIFSGGFGAESDAPGEGIWALVSHARMTRDQNWLRSAFPDIRRRVLWIEKMIVAAAPLRAMTENRTPESMNSPGGSILCLAADRGLIHGRMDHHSPDFYINCWAHAGLRLAADAALELGESADATRWSALATELDTQIAARLLPSYGNERDPVVTPYPTGALSSHGQALRDAFVKEAGESLVLGLGVPACWMNPGSQFGVRDMPTDRVLQEGCRRGLRQVYLTVVTDNTVAMHDGQILNSERERCVSRRAGFQSVGQVASPVLVVPGYGKTGQRPVPRRHLDQTEECVQFHKPRALRSVTRRDAFDR